MDLLRHLRGAQAERSGGSWRREPELSDLGGAGSPGAMRSSTLSVTGEGHKGGG